MKSFYMIKVIAEAYAFYSWQVEHKAGVLSITATKDKADVDVKSDTIRLLVKPGDRQYPVGDAPEVKTVHIEGNYPQIYPV